MRNAMKLKAIMKNIAKEKNITPQVVLQNYMFERLLERISLSKYKNSFILKGGLLISSMVGLDTRTTMDLDATIKDYSLSEESIKTALADIINIDIEDGVTFAMGNIKLIRESDSYGGFRASLDAIYEELSVPLKLDITTGDKITPKEVSYSFKLMLEERSIQLFAYNIETILAEKIETILSRGVLNTRPRDFYDVYILTKLYSENIDKNILKDALNSTCLKRETQYIFEKWDNILDEISNSPEMLKRWNLYQKEYFYASEIEFIDILQALKNYFR